MPTAAQRLTNQHYSSTFSQMRMDFPFNHPASILEYTVLILKTQHDAYSNHMIYMTCGIKASLTELITNTGTILQVESTLCRIQLQSIRRPES